MRAVFACCACGARYDPVVYAGNATVPRYLASVYYSVVTLTTLGYGDVTPTNQVDIYIYIIII